MAFHSSPIIFTVAAWMSYYVQCTWGFIIFACHLYDHNVHVCIVNYASIIFCMGRILVILGSTISLILSIWKCKVTLANSFILLRQQTWVLWASLWSLFDWYPPRKSSCYSARFSPWWRWSSGCNPWAVRRWRGLLMCILCDRSSGKLHKTKRKQNCKSTYSTV